MDSYEKFLGQIRREIQKALGEDVQIEVFTCWRNNGIQEKALRISGTAGGLESCMMPVIYLRPYYEKLKCGMMTMKEVTGDILRLLELEPPEGLDLDEDLSDFGRMREKLLFKVIHAETNARLLEETPHMRFLDLAIVFYLMLDQNDAGQLVALIHNDHLKGWECGTKDLWEAARVNTPKALPAQIKSMKEVMMEMLKASLGSADDAELVEMLLEDENDEAGMYVLSNRTGTNGACCMLYEGVLKAFADRLGSDLIILPSSLHEVLLMKDHEGQDYETCRRLVKSVNEEEVPLEDRLSNEVYRYIRETDQIVMAQGKTEEKL